MEKYKNTILVAIIASEASHIFCCVLPTLFSIVSMLSGFGLVTLPLGWVRLHDVLHKWEMPMIGFSATVLIIGWSLHWYTEHMLTDNTHTHTHCCHEPCQPKQNRVHFILKIATVLFVANLVIYLVFHRGLGITPHVD